MFEGKKIILASQSPRRRGLLKYIFDDFEVIPSDADETPPEGVEAACVPEILAVRKALDVYKSHPDALVIGCDTVVILDGKIYGKPHDLPEAVSMLKTFSDRTQDVISGVCICYGGRTLSFSQRTGVTFYPLSEEEILRYLEKYPPYDRAGSYGIQDHGGLFVKALDGEHYNVMGFPIARLRIELSRLWQMTEGGK